MKKCSYCHKEITGEAVKRTIINFKMYGRGGCEKEYCSEKCGAYDQMAHEGQKWTHYYAAASVCTPAVQAF